MLLYGICERKAWSDMSLFKCTGCPHEANYEKMTDLFYLMCPVCHSPMYLAETGQVFFLPTGKGWPDAQATEDPQLPDSPNPDPGS